MACGVIGAPLADSVRADEPATAALSLLARDLLAGLACCRLLRDARGNVSDLVVTQADAATARILSRSSGDILGLRTESLPGLTEEWPSWREDLGTVASGGGSVRRYLGFGAGNRLSVTAFRIDSERCGLIFEDAPGSEASVHERVLPGRNRGDTFGPDLVALIDRDYRFVVGRAVASPHSDAAVRDIAGQRIGDVLDRELFERELRPVVDRAFRGESGSVVTRWRDDVAGAERYVESIYSPVPDTDPIALVTVTARDVTASVVRDREHSLLVALLRLLNLPTTSSELARDVADLLYDHSGCEATAIRLRDGEGFRLVGTRGFGERAGGAGVLACEARLSGEHTAYPCDVVLNAGNGDGLRRLTRFGSFVSNSAAEWTTAHAGRDGAGHGPGCCIADGYQSVALIPVRDGDETLGMLMLCDSRANAFQPDYVSLLEGLATSLGMGLARRLNDEAMRAGEAQLREVVNHSLDGVVMVDAAGIIRLWNEAEEAITGISAGDAVGKPIWQIEHRAMLPERREPASLEGLRRRTMKILRSLDGGVKEGSHHEWHIQRPDGQRRVVQSTFFPMGSGRNRLLYAVSRDVTEQRQAEAALQQSERRYRQMFEGNLSGLALIEIVRAVDGQATDYRFVEVNGACERILGLSKEHLLGKPLRVLAPGIEPPWLDQYAQVDETGQAVSFEALSPGLGRYLAVRAFPYQPGQVAVAVEDITERRAAEQALIHSEERVRKVLSSILDTGSESATLELRDVIDREALQSLLGDLVAVTGVPVAILDLHGEILVAAGWQDICTRFHRVHPDTCLNCLESDTVLTSGIKVGTFQRYRCKNNMWDVATPLVVGGERVGNLFIGQFFYDDEEVDEEVFRAQAQRYGFDLRAYLQALSRVPRLSRRQISTMLSIYAKLAEMVGSLSQSSTRLAHALSDRDRLLDEVRRSEEKYRDLVENAEEAIYVVQDGVFRFVNRKAAEVVGCARERILGAGIAEFIHPDDRDLVVGRYRRRVQGVQEPRRYSFRMVRADGQPRWIDLSVVPIEWEGRPATLNFASDVTERRLAQEAIAAGEERFRRLAETIPLGILEIDPDGCIHYVNAAYARLYGYTDEQAVGGYLWDPCVNPGALRGYFERIRSGALTPEPWFGQSRASDGRVLDLRVDWGCRRGPSGALEGITAIITDITVQRQLEAQLLQAQKMESVGRLAGGVAHDFNNLLTAISGYAEFVLDELGPDSKARADAEEVLRNAERASDLTRQLLAFSRKQTMSMRPVDLNALVLDLGKLLRRLIGEDIELVLMPADPLPLVLADAAQIEQVIVNLAVNARDAMQCGGHLTIRTAMTALPAGVGGLHADVSRGPYVVLEVSDTGSGMSEDVMEHLFEPFYTTKDPDKGTGLGLATVYGIVSQHGGHVTADSTPGAGSTFRVYLPLGEEGLGQDRLEASDVSTHGGGETILIVEDEPQVRAVERRTLQRLGYRVMEAANGEEALRLVSSLERLPDLVVTDMVMPRMGGVEMAAKLGDLYPGLRCLFTSGYADDAHDLKLATGSGHYLHKPFSAQALGDAVRRALEAPSNPPRLDAT